jgi:hypothetical protein
MIGNVPPGADSRPRRRTPIPSPNTSTIAPNAAATDSRLSATALSGTMIERSAMPSTRSVAMMTTDATVTNRPVKAAR